MDYDRKYRKPDEPRYFPWNVGAPLAGWGLCPECSGYSRLDEFKHEPGCNWPVAERTSYADR